MDLELLQKSTSGFLKEHVKAIKLMIIMWACFAAASNLCADAYAERVLYSIKAEQ